MFQPTFKSAPPMPCPCMCHARQGCTLLPTPGCQRLCCCVACCPHAEQRPCIALPANESPSTRLHQHAFACAQPTHTAAPSQATSAYTPWALTPDCHAAHHQHSIAQHHRSHQPCPTKPCSNIGVHHPMHTPTRVQGTMQGCHSAMDYASSSRV